MKKKTSIVIELPNNNALSIVIGPHDNHLRRLEESLDLSIALRGNKISITGNETNIHHVKNILKNLYNQALKEEKVTMDDVSTALRHVHSSNGNNMEHYDAPSITTQKRIISPRSIQQSRYIQAMHQKDMVFGVGPAGTGKTYLAAAYGISLLLEGKVERIILSRPAVEAGEKLGFLPGDMREKVDPYLRPLYDALNDMLSSEQIDKKLASNEIEVAPLAFMRGRTLSNAFIILDEAQNTTSVQMKMILTRLGNYSKMVINGDLSQIDLPRGVTSGLADALNHLEHIDDIDVVRFSDKDVVRHQLVGKIVKAYADG